MSRTRKLSLRARMLVMLVGVTTVLLLIMGTVSTYLLASRVDGQAAAVARHLSTTATVLASEPQLAAEETGYAAVEIPLRAPLCRPKADHGHGHDGAGRSGHSVAGKPGPGAGQERWPSDGHLAAAEALLTAGGCQQLPRAGLQAAGDGPEARGGRQGHAEW